MRKFITLFVAAAAILGTGVTASAASAKAPAAQIRIGGLGFSSLGEGGLDLTPGIESVILLNYSFSPKNLKGYTLSDKGGNVIPLCAAIANTVVDCTSTTEDADNDGVFNVNDSNAWVTLNPRSQTSLNVEARNDGPWLGDGGDTVYLKNSVGKLLTEFRYWVNNPAS